MEKKIIYCALKKRHAYTDGCQFKNPKTCFFYPDCELKKEKEDKEKEDEKKKAVANQLF